MTAAASPAVPAGIPVDDLAAVALENLTRAYPYATHHTQTSAEDLGRPEDYFPAFATSFDWHSSVHMHWLLVTLTDLTGATAPEPAWRRRALEVLTEHLTPEHLAVEAAYLRANPTWERPYGWAWAAQLADALDHARSPELRALAEGARPLLDTVLDLVIAWLPKTTEPVRHGRHTNAAFALRRILHVAERQGRDDAVEAIAAAARRFFGADTAWSFAQERSGEDFLSAGLCEADLMIEVLDPAELATWLPAFLSELGAGSRILTPVEVLDPSDGYQSHLDGLGLTAAASALRVAGALEELGDEQLASVLRTAAPGLMAPGLAAAVSDEYMASHWLATFAWEALVQASASHVVPTR